MTRVWELLEIVPRRSQSSFAIRSVDAIKVGEDGIVRSALKPRCIGCSNCVLACPFGTPKVTPEYEQMMKCDMCYDRT